MGEHVTEASADTAISRLGLAVARLLEVGKRLANARKGHSMAGGTQVAAEVVEVLEREYEDARLQLQMAQDEVLKLLEGVDVAIGAVESDSELLSGVRLQNRAMGRRLGGAKRLLGGERSSLAAMRGRLARSLSSGDSGSSGWGPVSSGSTELESVFYEVFEGEWSSDVAEIGSRVSAPEYFGESLVISDSGGRESMSYEPVSLASWLADDPGTGGPVVGGEGEGAGVAEGTGPAGGSSRDGDGDGDWYGGPDNGGGRTP